jgi:oligopeptide transport system permease protein
MESTAKVSDAGPGWMFPRLSAGRVGVAVLLLIALPCILTLPWSAREYSQLVIVDPNQALCQPPTLKHPLGTDGLGRSLMWRCLMGGAISLGVGICAATISVVIGVMWGAIAGLAGGRTDAFMMRIVDILYGLPYILLVVLVKIALQPTVAWALMGPGDFSTPEATGWLAIPKATANQWAAIVTLLIAIGGVSWLTMARVIRGQVLSLRAQPFVEAARACGVGPMRILRVHLLPNLVGPIVVYTTLTVPTAILQESFLSFLGIGVQLPLPSWGNLATDGVKELHALASKTMVFRWWLAFWPCTLLGLTLLALNFLGDALRNRLDPRRLKK